MLVGEKALAVQKLFEKKAAANAAATAAAAAAKPVKAELDLTKDDSIEETSPVKSTAPMWRTYAGSTALVYNKGACTFLAARVCLFVCACVFMRHKCAFVCACVGINALVCACVGHAAYI